MAGFKHGSIYRFYIQRYSEGATKFPLIDIEEYFNCHYVACSNNNQTKVQNYYEETFSEKNGSNLWLDDNPTFAASDITLELLFKSNKDYEVLKDEQKFLDYITNKKFEYHDTFRPDRFWQLAFIDAPEKKGEILYGNQQYRHVAFKMRNWGGKYYKESQIK